MKMFSIRIFTVFVVSFGALFSCGTAFTTPSGNVNASCTPYQTECALGCCPYKDAVCCVDGFECCEHGQICIPVVGICMGIQSEEDGKKSLFSKQPTLVHSSVAACPQGTTSCGSEYCCPLPDAVCCPDIIHCCPHGYRCDMQRKSCVSESSNHTKSNSMEQEAVSVTRPSKMLNKLPYKVCPGGKMVCSNFNSCCIDDNGNWSCCPSFTDSQFRLGRGECCETIIGHLCCSDELPHCTPLGCVR